MHHLRLAFCIPGILHPEKSPQQIEYNNALSTFQINALGPLMLSKHFSSFLPRKSTELEPHDNLPSSAVLALMSARVGSISDDKLGGWYSYRASKAAVNSIAKSVDIYLRQRCNDKGMAVALHPGTVKTDLSEDFWGSTPKEKLFSVEFAAEKLVEVVNSVGLEGRGKCWDWEGKEIPP
jgi:NAD(P)-dependent dehydrogenase (short-subunit alcohol dehydrogenase family)